MNAIHVVLHLIWNGGLSACTLGVSRSWQPSTHTSSCWQRPRKPTRRGSRTLMSLRLLQLQIVLQTRTRPSVELKRKPKPKAKLEPDAKQQVSDCDVCSMACGFLWVHLPAWNSGRVQHAPRTGFRKDTAKYHHDQSVKFWFGFNQQNRFTSQEINNYNFIYQLDFVLRFWFIFLMLIQCFLGSSLYLLDELPAAEPQLWGIAQWILLNTYSGHVPTLPFDGGEKMPRDCQDCTP